MAITSRIIDILECYNNENEPECAILKVPLLVSHCMCAIYLLCCIKVIHSTIIADPACPLILNTIQHRYKAVLR